MQLDFAAAARRQAVAEKSQENRAARKRLTVSTYSCRERERDREGGGVKVGQIGRGERTERVEPITSWGD